MEDNYKIIRKLQEKGGTKDKETILRKAFKAEEYNLFTGLKLAYDPLVSFGIKKLPKRDIEDTLGHGSDFKSFIKLCTELMNRRLTGKEAIRTIKKFANGSDELEWELFYKGVLSKDLRCGIAEKTINNALSNIDSLKAKEYTIPIFSCALAEDFKKHPKLMDGIKMIDAKYDGVRILAILNTMSKQVTLHTRNGSITNNFPHINKALQVWIDRGLVQSLVLDGEVVASKFGNLMSHLNSKEGTVDTSDSKYHLFDCISMTHFFEGMSHVVQEERDRQLQGNYNNYSSLEGPLRVLPKTRMNISTQEGMEEFNNFYEDCLAKGLEGVMIKDPKATYSCGRNTNWLKKKPNFTVDLEVINVEEGAGRNEGKLGFLTCIGKYEGLNIGVRVGTGFTDKERAAIWDNVESYIGRTVEIKSDCVTKSSDGSNSLRFPRFVRFRDLEGDKGNKV